MKKVEKKKFNLKDFTKETSKKIKKLVKKIKVWFKSLTKKQRIEYSVFLGSILCLIIMVFIGKNIYTNMVYENVAPTISLVGNKIVEVNVNTKYVDKGVKIFDYIDKNLDDKVIVKGTVDTTKEGSYYLYYSVKNSRDIKSKEILRVVKVIDPDAESVEHADDETEDGKLTSSNTAKLKEVVTEVVLAHKSELSQFGVDTCKMADYLGPFVNEYYDPEHQPDREIMRPLIKTVIFDELGIE